MTKILITGANGFLGSHLTRKSVERGYAVRALCLPGTPAEHLRPFGAEIVHGDILKPETLRQAMEGVDLVFHVAGTTLEWHREQAFCYRVNAIGTRNVCRAALEAGVRRLVHTSSMAAVGSATSAGGEPDEDRLFDLWNMGLYSRSKFLGEISLIL